MNVKIENGKVNGRPILKAWESFHGWYWFGVEEVEPGYWYGFVIGFYPEWGYFSEVELKELMKTGMVWEIKKHDLPYVSMEV